MVQVTIPAYVIFSHFAVSSEETDQKAMKSKNPNLYLNPIIQKQKKKRRRRRRRRRRRDQDRGNKQASSWWAEAEKLRLLGITGREPLFAPPRKAAAAAARSPDLAIDVAIADRSFPIPFNFDSMIPSLRFPLDSLESQLYVTLYRPRSSSCIVHFSIISFPQNKKAIL